MKRNSYWKARLERWQLWVFSPGGGSRAWYVERVDCAVSFENTTPAINDEAVVTDMAVASLQPDLKRTIKAVYLDGIGNSLDGIATRLRIGRSTLHARLCHADLRLDIWLDERAKAAKTISRVTQNSVKSVMLGRATPSPVGVRRAAVSAPPQGRTFRVAAPIVATSFPDGDD